MSGGGYLVCDRINVRKARTLELKVDNIAFQVEVSPQEIVVPNIGRYNGHDRRLSVKSEHVCGLMGYDPMQGDNCPACEEYAQNSNVLDSVISKLRKMRLLKEYKI